MDYAKHPELQRNSNVLIVDDVPDNLSLLSNILEEMNIDVEIASSGQKALRMIENRKPDLILLDISMPEMDGFEVCNRLKADTKFSNIPIIFLTARTEIQDIIKGFKLGAVDYVTKPFNTSELISRVETHLELKKSRDIIAVQNQDLQELNTMKDKFFSIVAHDLKNPFFQIMNDSETLLKQVKKINDETIEKQLENIFRQSKQSYTLLQNLLEWSRSQTGTLKWEPETIDLTQIIDEIITLLRSIANNKEILLYKVAFKDTFAFADAKMVKATIRNLTTNALKFTERGGEVMVVTEDLGDFIEITISDNGIGIPKEDIEKLFRIDVHYSNPGTEGEDGTGLGLILCKEFVERNGGSIYVESEVNKGSKFKFTLPKKE